MFAFDGDVVADEAAEGLRCGDGVDLYLGAAIGLIHGDHGVGPAQQVVTLIAGDAK